VLNVSEMEVLGSERKGVGSVDIWSMGVSVIPKSPYLPTIAGIGKYTHKCITDWKSRARAVGCQQLNPVTISDF
jgi:hypothetical protein